MSGVGGVLAGIGGGAPGTVAVPGNGANAGSTAWILLNDGTYNIDGLGTGNWATPATTGIAAGYQVKTVVNSGTFTADPSAGSFIDMTSTRTWSKTGAGTVNFTVTIREKATGLVRATATRTLTTS